MIFKYRDSQVLSLLKKTGIYPQVIEALAIDRIIHNESQAQAVSISADDIQLGLETWMMQNHPGSSFQKWLNENDMSQNDVENFIHTKLLSSKLKHKLFDDRVKPYFFNNYDKFQQVWLLEVPLSSQNRALAFELYYSLLESEISFADAARYSRDCSCKIRGGDRGFVYRHELNPEIASMIFSCEQPRLLFPIVLEPTIYLIEVKQILSPSFEQQFDSILENIFNNWLRAKLDDVRVEWQSELYESSVFSDAAS